MTTTLFHGSTRIIENPQFGLGNPHNDYGLGFYCTDDRDLAGEWACKSGADGFVNRYEIDSDKLKMLDLMAGEYTVLSWIALLLKNRTFAPRTARARETKGFFIERFAPDLDGYDVIRGYRADDSYFSYAEQFIENSLSVEELNQALYLGELGIQTVLISERAFAALEFVEAESAQASTYAPRFARRDREARERFLSGEVAPPKDCQETYARDIVKGGVDLDCIPRMLPW